GVQLAVFAGVAERNVGISALSAEIDFASIKGLRINVDADGTLAELSQVHDFVDRLDGIHVGGMRGVEIVSISRDDFTSAVGGVAAVNTIVLDAQPADGRGHPAILVAMIVDAAVLADFPADGHTFKEIILEN